MNKKTTLQKIDEAKEQIKQLYSTLTVEFWTHLNDIFEKYPKLESIDVGLNNHEFNDGDPTTFYMRYEDDMIRYLYDGERVCLEEIKYEDSPSVNPDIVNVVKNINDEVVRLFDTTRDIHEKMFGDEYGELTITKKTVKNKIK